MNEQLWWYVARSGGIVALFLAGLSVIAGLLFSARALGRRPGPKWQLAMHRFLGTLAVVFTAVHIIGLVADTYVEFGLVDVLVPMASEWRPIPVAFGVIAFYLLVAVEITSVAMKHLPRRLWKWIHLSSYILLWTGLIHGATAGSDAANPVYVAATVGMVTLTAVLTLYRIAGSRLVDRALTHGADN